MRNVCLAAVLVVSAALAPRPVDAQELVSPRRARTQRTNQRLGREALDRLLRPSVEASLAPCEVTDLELPTSLVLPVGAPSVVSLAAAPRTSGRVTAVLIVTVGTRDTRVLASARVVCPVPVMLPGARVRVVVVVGAVRASASGIVSQPGRVGDEVRVTNVETRVQLRGRVIDSGTVEVRP